MNEGLIHGGRGGPAALPGAWAVEGVCDDNTAAKFWPALLDEVDARFPGWHHIELSTLSSGLLDGRLLFPVRDLEEAMASMPEDIEGEMAEVLNGLEAAGPPPAVRVKIHDATGPAYDGVLPPGSADAEVFLYLLAWLLRWAGIPETLWQQPELEGRFSASDRCSRRRYELSLSVRQLPAHEGLVRREVLLRGVVRDGNP